MSFDLYGQKQYASFTAFANSAFSNAMLWLEFGNWGSTYTKEMCNMTELLFCLLSTLRHIIEKC